MSNHSLRESERAINRSLFHVSITWCVPIKDLKHNPVFLREGYLHFHEPVGHREEVFRYLKERGVVGDGYNGAFKLLYPFKELSKSKFEILDKAADIDYDKGISIDLVVRLLISQLNYEHNELVDPGRLELLWSAHLDETIGHLCKLGYVEQPSLDKPNRYQWAKKAYPLLNAEYLL